MTHETHPYWKDLYHEFALAANPEKAKWAEAYLKNQFEMFGLVAPKRAEIFKSFIQKNGLPPLAELDLIVRNAWELPKREMQYVGMELLFRFKKNTDHQFISLYEWIITHKSWWDTVDYIAPNLVGNLFLKFPELRDETVSRWMNSGNFWLQRTCLLFQLKTRTKTDQALLFDLCLRLKDEKEFFLRKAIGWSLREYAKTNPEAVRTFVENTELSGLSHREALKHLSKPEL